MIAVFEKTWLLWWMFTVVVILRWFHVLSAGPGSAALDSPNDGLGESHVAPVRLHRELDLR